MKKKYEKMKAEKIEFNYQETIVASIDDEEETTPPAQPHKGDNGGYHPGRGCQK